MVKQAGSRWRQSVWMGERRFAVRGGEKFNRAATVREWYEPGRAILLAIMVATQFASDIW